MLGKELGFKSRKNTAEHNFGRVTVDGKQDSKMKKKLKIEVGG